MQAREQAQKYALTLCQKENMQLLDGTVSLKKFGFEKSRRGGRYFLRYFRFEFSATGEDRREGILALSATHLFYSYLDLPESPTIEMGSDEDDPESHLH